MARGVNVTKNDPRHVAARALGGLEEGDAEVLADEQARTVKRTLSTAQPYYFDPPDIA